MSLIKESEDYLKSVISSLGYELDRVTLEVSSKPEFGQYQVNIAMALAKINGENPRELADKIIKSLDERFSNINIQGPGFINLSFSDEYLLKFANGCLTEINSLIDLEEKKSLIIDYGGANAAKALHVGHMRTANIGEALKRLARVFGHEAIGDVHLGDVGRQSGMIITEIMKREPNLIFFDENYHGEYPKYEITPEQLGIDYPNASIAASQDEARMESVRRITALVDKGNNGYSELWKQIVEVSKIDIKKTYDMLNCNFELWEGELSSLNYLEDTLNVLKPVLRESDDAQVIDLKEETDNKEIPPLIVLNSKEATTYAARDLATIYDRMNKYNPDEIWYIVDVRQSLHFEQLFRASYKSGLVKEDTKLYHYWNGTLNGKDGKPFKTRDGGTALLKDLISMVKASIMEKISENVVDKERTADILSIGVLKFADLLPFRTTDYIFDIDKFSSFEGKTGPYILYTAVRINSMLEKVNESSNEIKTISNDEVREILVKLTNLPKILKRSFNERSVNYICEFLYEFSSLFNKFYAEHNIINESDETVKSSYIGLSKLTFKTLKFLLDILAIEIPDKM